ncbi:MAG: hypothetical protein V5A76_08740, partial [Candidatus Thermoplasmatota archaeon]
QKIAEMLDCDEKEIFDKKKRSGILGYFRGGWDAYREKKTDIYNNNNGLINHDHSIIGTPVWAGKPTPAIRTYIKKRKQHFQKVSFFCTYGGSGGEKTFDEMKNLSEKEPIETLGISEDEVKEENFEVKVKKFVESIEKQGSNKKK